MSSLGRNSRSNIINAKSISLLLSTFLVFVALVGGFITGNMQPLQWMLPYLLGVISGRLVTG